MACCTIERGRDTYDAVDGHDFTENDAKERL